MKLIKLLIIIFSGLIFFSCTAIEDEVAIDLSEIKERGELRVVTLKSSLSYFQDDDDNEMGYEYNLALNFASYIDVPLKLILASNVVEMTQKLKDGEADIIAYRLVNTKQNQEELAFANNYFHSHIVLVQPIERNMVTDVTQLIGRDVHVMKGSKYERRLNNLNKELGGGINIIIEDSIDSDKLVVGVAKKEIPLTFIDSDIAIIMKYYFNNIDCNIQVGLSQQKAWTVRQCSPNLLAEINKWHESISKTPYYKTLYTRHYSKSNYLIKSFSSNKKGSISPYDDIYKKFAPMIGWDWKLLASIGFNESKFNPTVISSSGAVGVMQMMPTTAAKYGLDEESIIRPYENIEAAVLYIKNLNYLFRQVEDEIEKKKFILASYNAGPGHVLDAIRLTEKYGGDVGLWEDVEQYLLLKGDSSYYNDEVCKLGYFRANHTVKYVLDVFETYEQYIER